MNDLETQCYDFLIDLAKELSADFKTQYESMEEFARWNLPEEIALEWIDAEGMLQILRSSGYRTKEELDIFELIMDNFKDAFDRQLSHVWTYSAMQDGEFWHQQRNLAQKLLERQTKAGGSSVFLVKAQLQSDKNYNNSAKHDVFREDRGQFCAFRDFLTSIWKRKKTD